MPETPIARLFASVTAEPDADFVAALEARLVAELEASASHSELGGTSPTEEITLQLDGRDGPTPMIARAPVRPRRIGMAVLAAAAAAIVLVVTIVASGRDRQVITSTSTTVETTTTVAPTSPTTTPTSTSAPSTTPPSTTATSAPPATSAAAVVDPGFAQEMSTDLTSTEGSTLHFE
ncbi:MAG: hypothetical protein JWN39_1088, partial [Ilumatobacteraceae bacterium]|nr:hypothetical protein [Ilumatobacteraceae bacterium]